ncbi:ChaN family lipoprotein [Pseudomonas cichorii]|nr:ChaN family lipoprotein [Pseudomonas cichorii]
MKGYFRVVSLVWLNACQIRPHLPNLLSRQSPVGHGHLDSGMIRDNKNGQALSAQQLAERLAVAPRVLVGEQHDNPDHHALELWLLQVLAVRRPQGSLSLEMLSPDQQDRVDAVQSDLADGKYPTDLPAALNWQKSWDWSLYGPLMRYVLAQPYPVLSANLDADEVMPISRRMAQSLLAVPVPSVLFASAWHVRKDVGVPLHLADLGVTDPVVVLLLVRAGEEVEPQSADYVWYTAATPEKDHGAQFRQSPPGA